MNRELFNRLVSGVGGGGRDLGGLYSRLQSRVDDAWVAFVAYCNGWEDIDYVKVRLVRVMAVVMEMLVVSGFRDYDLIVKVLGDVIGGDISNEEYLGVVEYDGGVGDGDYELGLDEFEDLMD